MSAPLPERGATENSHPDGTRFPPTSQARARARRVADELREDRTHPVVVAAKRTNAGLAASRWLTAWRSRRRAAEPPWPEGVAP